MKTLQVTRRLVAMSVSALLATTGLAVVAAPAASAAILPTPAPVEQRSSAVTADSLPTVQIDSGVVWAQTVVGDTVYAGGSFSNARPAGAAPGTNLTPRGNLLAYNIKTGQLVTSFAPNLNGQVKTVTASPDGSRIYVGGSFTQANGSSRFNVAAFSTADGSLISTWKPAVGGSYVNAIVATNSTVYVGGLVSAGAGVARKNLMAFSATNGALLSWAPTADLQVDAMVMDPTKTKVIIGGRFGQVNGTAQRGMAALDPTTGALLPWAVAQTVQVGLSSGPTAGKAGIFALTANKDAVFGTTWVFSDAATGNLEGSFAAEAGSGDVRWIEDCRGDQYGLFANDTTVYLTGHPHDCAAVGGYPQAYPAPGNMRNSLAFSAEAKGTLAHSQASGIYNDWGGKPAPAMINWFPDWTTGTATGQGQAGWSASGNNDYLVIGGEFPFVNGQRQQGLARFAVSAIAPDKEGPRLSGDKWTPTGISVKPGTVRLSIPANWDRDDTTLTYKFIRNNNTANPIFTTTATNSFWNRGNLSFSDTGLTAGSTYNYRVIASDPDGNTVNSATVPVTVTNQAMSAYAQSVLDDSANLFWRLDEPTGTTTAYDWAGANDGAVGSGVTRGATGAINGDSDTASTFNGTESGNVVTPTAEQGPDTFTAEAWVRTTTTSGGKIIGFGNNRTGGSGSYDRHVYMTNDGRIKFGVYTGNTVTITSPTAYNDGQWHHVVASMGSTGMVLYIDGMQIGTTSTTAGQPYTGYWRVGGDSLGGWPDQPSSQYFAGDIDDVAVYPTVLTKAQVRNHYTKAGYTVNAPVAPSDAYGAAVYALNPSLYWRLNDASGATTAADSGDNQNPGGVSPGGVTFGQPAGIGSGTAASFNGNTGSVVSSKSEFNPNNYTETAWFKTTTTSGGKIIGFGSGGAAGNTSGSYDRHVYMQDDGHLVFGTWTGFTNTISTPQAYNDGTWHQVVASQGPGGMKLYVDGALIGTNPQTGAEGYTGYWRIGGDNTWGSSSPWFNGTLDEAAVFGRVLTDGEVSSLYTTGIGGQPTAAFTSSNTDLTAAVDGSTSAAAQGRTIANYSWNWGDGSPASTGATATHAYAAPGSYNVTLTVKDNLGVTGTTTKSVTVTAAHAAPTAAIAATPAGLSVAFSSSNSSTSDGATLTGYSWDFGDGKSSTDANPSHTYAAAGSYTAKLVVTDSVGASSTAAEKQVTLTHTAPTAAIAATVDQLSVSVDGSGSSATDGATLTYDWSWGDNTAHGTGATATHTYGAAGNYTVTLTVTDSLGSSSSTTRDVTVAAHANPVPAFTATANQLAVSVDGSGSTASDGATMTYAWNWGDSTATGTGITANHTYAAAGTYAVTLTVTDSRGASDTLSKNVVVTAPPVVNDIATDAFTRSTASGWGSADLGGAWSGTTGFSTNGSGGQVSVGKSQTRLTNLTTVAAQDSDSSFDLSMDKVADGGGAQVNYVIRKTTAGEYRAKVRVSATGAVTLSIAKYVGTTETLIANKTISGYTYSPGSVLHVRLQAVGSGTTALKAKVWADAAAEPTAWTLTASDNQADLQGPGAIGFNAFVSGTTTNGPVVMTFDNLKVIKP